LSDPFKVAVTLVNETSASLTAFDIAVELRYPHWIVSEGDNQFTQPEPPGINAQQLLNKDISLNPGATYYMRSTFTAPRGHKRLQVLAVVSARDSMPIDKMLEVELVES
jgi:hypothetical protein